jgi:hypothetical protein
MGISSSGLPTNRGKFSAWVTINQLKPARAATARRAFRATKRLDGDGTRGALARRGDGGVGFTHAHQREHVTLGCRGLVAIAASIVSPLRRNASPRIDHFVG